MAERVPFFTLFESFQAPRQLRLLLHDACIISGALDMAGRTLEVQIESSETLPQAAQDALQQMLAQQFDRTTQCRFTCQTGTNRTGSHIITMCICPGNILSTTGIKTLRTHSITKADIVIFIITCLIELIQIISHFPRTCKRNRRRQYPFRHLIQIIATGKT